MRSDTIYSLCDTIIVGCKIYTDSRGKRLATAGKYSDGVNCYTVNSLGVVTAAELCGATTTTTSTTSTTTTSTTSTTTTSTTTTSTTSTTTTTTTEPPVEQARLLWSFTESNGGQAQYDLYVNDVIVETRFSTSNGEIFVNDGDSIYVSINMNQCSTFPNTYANAYTLGIINEASCVQNGPASLLTFPYYVTSGDVGTDISLAAFARCDSGCV